MTGILPRDENRVTAVGFESSTTPGLVLAGQIDEATGKILVQNPATSGAGAPASTPTFIGQIYVDTTGPDIYIAAGTTNSNDWKVVFNTP